MNKKNRLIILWVCTVYKEKGITRGLLLIKSEICSNLLR